MLAGFRIDHRLRSSSIVDARSVTAPATTGEATEVPERLRHPPRILLPMASLPYATTSGLILPYPFGSSCVVIPRLENGAIFPS